MERSDFGKSFPEKKIAAWEEGSEAPTFRDLEKFARKVHRPVSAFFLPDAPLEPALPIDFRVRSSREPGAFEPKTLLAFREARSLANQTTELLDILGEQVALDLPRISDRDDPEDAGSSFRSTCGISVSDQLKWKGSYATLDAWRAMLFDRGVLVFQFSLNSDDAQGFTLRESNVGVVGLCSKNEDPVVRCFSLFHEVCHLCLDKPAVSGGETMFLRRPVGRTETIEVFCNRFAAAFLLPLHDEKVKADLKSILDKRAGVDRSSAVDMARRYKVSKYVVLFRAREAGHLSWDQCMDVFHGWKAEDEKNPPQKKPSKIPPVSKVTSARGKRFMSLVFEALDRGHISLHEAADYLSLKPKHFDDARDKAGRGRL